MTRQSRPRFTDFRVADGMHRVVAARLILRAALIVALVVLLLGTGMAYRAFAAPEASTTSDAVVTETYSWRLPDGGSASDVTWPQPLVGAGRLVPSECGVTYQVDTYTGTREAIDAVVGDGVLIDAAEDAAVYVGHEFTYGGDCPEVPPNPGPLVDVFVDYSTDCDGVITRATSTYLTPQVWDGARYVPDVDNATSDTVFAVVQPGDVPADAVVFQPSDCPTAQPPATVPPTVTPPAAAPAAIAPAVSADPAQPAVAAPGSVAATHDELAATGVSPAAGVLIAASVIILGAYLVVFGRKARR
jgi:hypothetical protein